MAEKTLREAAEDAARWLQSPKDGHANEVFEDIADWFEMDTGLLRPGKDYPMASAPPDDLEEKWQEWCTEKRRSIQANLRAALENTQGEDREADRPDLDELLEATIKLAVWEWDEYGMIGDDNARCLKDAYDRWLKSREDQK